MSWPISLKIAKTDFSKYKNEKWITLYRAFMREVPVEVYCEMIDKVNKGLII